MKTGFAAATGDIHVVYLEHANAEDLAQVLSNLTQEANQRAQQNTRNTRTTRGGAQRGNTGGMRC